MLEAATRAYAAAVHLDADELSGRYLAQLPILPNTTEALTAFEPEADAHGQPPGSGLFVYEPVYESTRAATIASAELAPAVDWSPPQHSATTRDYRLPIAALLIVSAIAVGVGYLVGASGSRGSDRSTTVDARVATTAGSPAQQPDRLWNTPSRRERRQRRRFLQGILTVTTTNEGLDAATTRRSRNTTARGKEPGAGRALNQPPSLRIVHRGSTMRPCQALSSTCRAQCQPPRPPRRRDP